MVRWYFDKNSYLQVIEQSVEVGADSSQFPTNWIFHSREKKPGKAFVDGLVSDRSFYYIMRNLFVGCLVNAVKLYIFNSRYS